MYSKQELARDMLSDAPAGIGYWAATNYTSIDELEIFDRETGQNHTVMSSDMIEGFKRAVVMFMKRGKNNSSRYRWDDCLHFSGATAMNDWDFVTYDSEMLDIVVQMALFGEVRYS